MKIFERILILKSAHSLVSLEFSTQFYLKYKISQNFNFPKQKRVNQRKIYMLVKLPY